MFPSEQLLPDRGKGLNDKLLSKLPDFLLSLFSSIAFRELKDPRHPFYKSILLKICVKFFMESLLALVLLGFSIYDFMGGAYASSVLEAFSGVFLLMNTPIVAKRWGLKLSNNLSLILIGFLILVVSFEILPQDSMVISGALIFPVLSFIYKGKEGIYWSVEFAVLHVLTLFLSLSYYSPYGAIVDNDLWLKGTAPDLSYIIGSVYLIYFLLSGVMFVHYLVIESYRQTYAIYSSTDRLTGALNRVASEEVFYREFARVMRYSVPMSVIIFDIDDFKGINDTYGHSAGDGVLTEIARVVSSNVRDTDYLIRWGGEEFLLLCPETNISEAFKLADKLRVIIERHSFPVDRKITASFGVSSFSFGDSLSSLINRADEALYEAKRSGKNRVCISKPAGKVCCDAEVSSKPSQAEELL